MVKKSFFFFGRVLLPRQIVKVWLSGPIGALGRRVEIWLGDGPAGLVDVGVRSRRLELIGADRGLLGQSGLGDQSCGQSELVERGEVATATESIRSGGHRRRMRSISKRRRCRSRSVVDEVDRKNLEAESDGSDLGMAALIENDGYLEAAAPITKIGGRSGRIGLERRGLAARLGYVAWLHGLAGLLLVLFLCGLA